MTTPPTYTGQIIVSVVVLALLGTDGTLILLHALPAGAEDVAKLFMGGMISMGTIVVQWWMGSSKSSTDKTPMIYNSTPNTPSGG